MFKNVSNLTLKLPVGIFVKTPFNWIEQNSCGMIQDHTA